MSYATSQSYARAGKAAGGGLQDYAQGKYEDQCKQTAKDSEHKVRDLKMKEQTACYQSLGPGRSAADTYRMCGGPGV